MDIIRRAADPTCSLHIQHSIEFIDGILESDMPILKSRLKALFGLDGLEHDEDFASLLEVRSRFTRIWYALISRRECRVRWGRGKPKIGILKLEARASTNFVRCWTNRSLG